MIGIDTSVLVAWELPEHPEHTRLRSLLANETAAGTPFVIASQVLAEFIHIVTDGRRFSSPLDVSTALTRAEWWQQSTDVIIPPVSTRAYELFFTWMRDHSLGRKRVLDTLLAATYAAHGVNRVLTLNTSDFILFGAFTVVS
jgi:predicted nucleic acid-binding protein